MPHVMEFIAPQFVDLEKGGDTTSGCKGLRAMTRADGWRS